ncbi:hypothetical protein BDR03DRAFT_950307, partial [Suillus americanus]
MSTCKIGPIVSIRVRVPSQKIPHHPAQKMRYSFLAVVVALAASMSVNACQARSQPCKTSQDCCKNLNL